MKRFIFVVVMVCVLFSSFSVFAAVQGTARLTWDCQPTRVDNSFFDCISEPKFYNAYYWITGQPVSKTTITVGTGFPALLSGMTYTVSNLAPGKQYNFNVTVVDGYGLESDASNIVAKTIPLPAAPGAPRLNSVIVAFIGMVLAFIALLFA
jgi:hypothetical protein